MQGPLLEFGQANNVQLVGKVHRLNSEWNAIQTIIKIIWEIAIRAKSKSIRTKPEVLNSNV